MSQLTFRSLFVNGRSVEGMRQENDMGGNVTTLRAGQLWKRLSYWPMWVHTFHKKMKSIGVHTAQLKKRKKKQHGLRDMPGRPVYELFYTTSYHVREKPDQPQDPNCLEMFYFKCYDGIKNLILIF